MPPSPGRGTTAPAAAPGARHGATGIGRYFVQGALNRDYTLVMGVVLLYGTLIVLFNLLVDLLYGLLDPRLRPA